SRGIGGVRILPADYADAADEETISAKPFLNILEPYAVSVWFFITRNLRLYLRRRVVFNQRRILFLG
ncbi:MAG: hypothetical protein WBP45_08445, partial [Daejeonella sp.]